MERGIVADPGTSDDKDPRAAEAGNRQTRLLTRRDDDRVVAGLASAIAGRLGVDASYVRAGFVVLALAGGVGVVAYLVGWAISGEGTTSRSDGRITTTHQRVGLVAMFVAILLILREIGLWFGDAVVWPGLLIAMGLAVTWDRSGRESGFLSWAFPGIEAGTRPTTGRVIGGAVLMVAGFSLLVSSIDVFADMGIVILAVIVTGGGLSMVLGPWIWRLATDLGRERADRIRESERADVAAHLHDSVLQTLALIQRTDDPRRMITLARAQERELRSWLFERSPRMPGDRFVTALGAALAKVEGAHHVPVELVTVGDVALDERVDALVRATAEAASNAARHSGAARVSVYAEVSEDRADVWVSDQGTGFDPESVAPDRHGIAQSIVGRLERRGGEATVETELGAGTEVHLTLPLEAP